MQEPCRNCPFRTDRPFRGLTRDRVVEIHQAIHDDSHFTCHKFIGKTHKKLCVGSVMYLTYTGDPFANLSYRLGAMRGDFYPEKINWEIPVAQNLEEFIDVATSSNYESTH
jgi:hypothetical protein